MTEQESAALYAAVPDITATGGSIQGDVWVELDGAGATLVEASLSARKLLEPALPPGVVVRVGHADELMHDRQVMLWTAASRSSLHRWEAAVADVARRRSIPESKGSWRIWNCQIERHFCLVAANNLRRAVLNASGRFPGMDPELAESVWVLRDVTEHWDEQWPDFYDQRYTGKRRRAVARFEQRHPRRSPFIFEAWTSADGPMLGPGFPSSQLRRYLDLIESAVLVLRPDFAGASRFSGV